MDSDAEKSGKPDAAKENNLSAEDNLKNKPVDNPENLKINKRLLIAAAVIILLLIIAYILYHYNILGVRGLVRNTLGLNKAVVKTTSNSTVNSTAGYANSALVSLMSEYFPALNEINFSAFASASKDIHSTNFEHYSVFGAGQSEKAFENGTYPADTPGLLILFATLKNNETLGYYYHGFSGSPAKIYNISFGGMQAIESILNTTPPRNASFSLARGTFNLSGYNCNSSGFHLILNNTMNETLDVTAAHASAVNMTGNGSIFKASSNAVKPNGEFVLSFPEERCNSTSYGVIVNAETNYTIANESSFGSEIKFSPKLNTVNQSEVITVLGVTNSTLYEVSILASKSSYLTEVNSSLDKLLNNLTANDFT